jgi:hypothetical protein
MEQNVNHKLEHKHTFHSFYNTYKKKIYYFIGFFIIIIFLVTFLIQNNIKNNSLTAEKYVEAGLYFSSGNKLKSKAMYEEIMRSENKFYSILALNEILEKELISDKIKILNYFEIAMQVSKSHEQLDLINFKKALYLLKISNDKEANDILNNLIKKNSKLKTIAKEVITK